MKSSWRIRNPSGRRGAGVSLACGLRVLGLAGMLSTATTAHAELAVLANGDVMKVDTYRLEGRKMRLELASGGALTLAIERIERIVDDEIVIVPPEEQAREMAATPAFGLAFDASEPIPDTPFGSLIYDAARQYELNPRLLAAMARAESAFDSRAVSSKGARGLLQLMPATAERFGVRPRDLFDPKSNLDAAARYLRFLIAEFEGDLRHILAAYNAGEGAVRRHGGIPPYRETRNYIARIYSFLGLEDA